MSESPAAGIERTTKRWFAYALAGLVIPTTLAFAAFDLVQGDWTEAAAELVVAIVFASGIVFIRLYDADTTVYRVSITLVSACFLYETAIGAGEGSVLYWLFALPPAFVFLLGRRVGIRAFLVFWACLAALLLAPGWLGTHPYESATGIRALISLFFVAAVAYGLESSRTRYGALMLEYHQRLLEEKKNTEEARENVSILRSLIPICAYCKNVRDDAGYWHQVESYVHDHYEAEFSHGICPECYARLEDRPEFQA